MKIRLRKRKKFRPTLIPISEDGDSNSNCASAVSSALSNYNESVLASGRESPTSELINCTEYYNREFYPCSDTDLESKAKIQTSLATDPSEYLSKTSQVEKIQHEPSAATVQHKISQHESQTAKKLPAKYDAQLSNFQSSSPHYSNKNGSSPSSQLRRRKSKIPVLSRRKSFENNNAAQTQGAIGLETAPAQVLTTYFMDNN